MAREAIYLLVLVQEIVMLDVTNMCLEVLNTDEPIPEIESTTIALILKVKKVDKVSDFTLISLSNVVYKIILRIQEIV